MSHHKVDLDEQKESLRYNKKKDSRKKDNELDSQQQSQQDCRQSQSNQRSQQQPYPSSSHPSQNSIQFGQSAIQMKCPFCLQNIRSQIILKPQFISIIFGFSLFIIFPHLITLIVVIILLQLTSTKKHRCPLCERQLGSDGKFLLFFKDQVYSFALGTNGIIISKKILASVAIGVVVLLILSLKASSMDPQIQWTTLSYNEFTTNCPVQLPKCSSSYQSLTVSNWKGFIMRVQDNRNSYRRHFQYAVTLYIKMKYSTIQKQQKYKQKADLLLTVNNYQAHLWENILDNLTHGDEVIFNATFKTLRNNRGINANRHLNIVDLNKTNNRNQYIHVYMSQQEDQLFFDNLSGEKLRKHQDQQQKLLQTNINTQQQQQLINKQNKQNNKQKHQNIIQHSDPFQQPQSNTIPKIKR